MQTLARTVFHVPVFGWLLRDAVRGLPDAKYYFLANLVFCFGYLTYFIGYPFVIICALTGAAAMMVTLIVLTASDFIDGKRGYYRAFRTQPEKQG